MNILFICDEYPPQQNGGIGTFVQLLAEKLATKGHKVIVYGLTDINEGVQQAVTIAGNVTIIRNYYSVKVPDSISSGFVRRILLRVFAFFSLFFWKKKYHDKINSLIQKHNIDILETPDWDSKVIKNPFFDFLPSKVTCPVIVRLHGSHSFFQSEKKATINKLIFKKEKGLYQSSDGTINISRYAQKVYNNCYPNIFNDTIVIPNGVSKAELINKRKVKESYDFVFFGTLTKKKGIFSLAKAWNIVCEVDDHHQLHIYGKGDKKKVQQLLSKRALEQTIFHGHVNRATLLSHLQTYDIAVLPSYSETFGLAAIEAMNAGLATIFTEWTTGPEIISHNVDGLLVDPSSGDDIAEKITFLLNHPKDCLALAEKGKEKVKLFTAENTADQTIDFFQTIIKKYSLE